MPLVGVAQGRAKGTLARQQAGGLSISHCPPAGVRTVFGWWQKAWVSCSCPMYGFEELRWFSVLGTWPLCLSQSLAAGRHEAKGKWSPWVRRIGSHKTRIPPFPFPKSHCLGGWTSPSSSLPEKFTMYPMAWSHRRDTRWQHPTGAQALGCTQHPYFPGQPTSVQHRVGTIKKGLAGLHQHGTAGSRYLIPAGMHWGHWGP